MSNYKGGGYDNKYIISKANGNPVDPEAEYFVLRLDKDPHALKALETYQWSVVQDNPKLAHDLLQVLSRNRDIQNKKGEKK